MLTDLPVELRDTESAHKDAVVELERMRETMEKMEQERAEMVAEVEAQIERALESMAVGLDESDYESSRPHSRLSGKSGATSAGTRSRRPSDGARTRHLRSFATDSTLAETFEEENVPDSASSTQAERKTDTIEEGDEEESSSPKKKKRFSASGEPPDNMAAVDEGISQKSDKIAQKVLEIQSKVRSLG